MHQDQTAMARLIIIFGSKRSVLKWYARRNVNSHVLDWTYEGDSFSVVYVANSALFGHSVHHQSFNLDTQHDRQIIVVDFAPISGIPLNITAESVSKFVHFFKTNIGLVASNKE